MENLIFVIAGAFFLFILLTPRHEPPAVIYVEQRPSGVSDGSVLGIVVILGLLLVFLLSLSNG